MNIIHDDCTYKDDVYYDFAFELKKVHRFCTAGCRGRLLEYDAFVLLLEFLLNNTSLVKISRLM